MARQKYLLASEVDVKAIAGAMRAASPARITVKDVFQMLRDVIVEQRARGLTVAQLADIMSEHGVEVSERQMASYLDELDLESAPKNRPGRQSKAHSDGETVAVDGAAASSPPES